MSEDGKDVLGFIAGLVLIIILLGAVFAGIKWSVGPSPMQICIKAGYEWRGGDCVKAVDHADQQ